MRDTGKGGNEKAQPSIAGGYDTKGTPSASDDTVGMYSASGKGCPWCRNPDFVAVGSHLQGLRVPGGYIDANSPTGRAGSRYFRLTFTVEKDVTKATLEVTADNHYVAYVNGKKYIQPQQAATAVLAATK